MTVRLRGVPSYVVPDEEEPPPDPPPEDPGAVQFTASGQKFTRSASGLNLSSTDFTWCCWVKLSEVISAYSIALASDDAGSHYCQLGTTGDGVSLFMSNGGSSAFDLTQDVWAFIAAAIDRTGADSWIYYGEGAAPTLTREFLFSTPTSHLVDANTFTIGNDGFGDRFHGSVAAVKVWNAKLSQSELTTEATTYAAQRTSGLWAAYSFEFGPQTTDDSGNGRTITQGGTPVYDPVPPPIT